MKRLRDELVGEPSDVDNGPPRFRTYYKNTSMKRIRQNAAISNRKKKTCDTATNQRMLAAAKHLEALRAERNIYTVTDEIIEHPVTQGARLTARETEKGKRAIVSFKSPIELWESQWDIVHFVEGHVNRSPPCGCLICDAPGLGKTNAVLMCVLRDIQAKIRKNKNVRTNPTLIIFPKTNLNTWEVATSKFFGTDSPIQTMWLPSRESMRKTTLNNVLKSDIIFTSFPMLEMVWRERDNDPTIAELFYGHTWERFVTDEVHFICNNTSSNQFFACQAIKAITKLYVTGTPLQNDSKNDVVAAASFINDRSGTDFEKPEARSQWLATFMLRRTREDVKHKLPDIEYKGNLSFQLRLLQFSTVEEYNFYHNIKERPNNILPYLTDRRKACISPQLLRANSGTRIWHNPSTKINALLDYIRTEMRPGEKALIYSEWQATFDELEYWFEKHEICSSRMLGNMPDKLRNITLTNFSLDPSLKVLMMPFALGAAGLNLEFANHVIMVEPWWNPSLEDQILGRIIRPGQKKCIHAICFILDGTVENHVISLQDGKRCRNEEEFEQALIATWARGNKQ